MRSVHARYLSEIMQLGGGFSSAKICSTGCCRSRLEQTQSTGAKPISASGGRSPFYASAMLTPELKSLTDDIFSSNTLTLWDLVTSVSLGSLLSERLLSALHQSPQRVLCNQLNANSVQVQLTRIWNSSQSTYPPVWPKHRLIRLLFNYWFLICNVTVQS